MGDLRDIELRDWFTGHAPGGVLANSHYPPQGSGEPVIANSHFLQVDGEGKIVKATPNMTKEY
jgi:hypothetical protein